MVSSAYIINLNLSLACGRSFKYIINSRGPKMEPWGTPVDIGKWFDTVELNSTNCFLFGNF